MIMIDAINRLLLSPRCFQSKAPPWGGLCCGVCWGGKSVIIIVIRWTFLSVVNPYREKIKMSWNAVHRRHSAQHPRQSGELIVAVSRSREWTLHCEISPPWNTQFFVTKFHCQFISRTGNITKWPTSKPPKGFYRRYKQTETIILLYSLVSHCSFGYPLSKYQQSP